jgi:hypothetical protein
MVYAEEASAGRVQAFEAEKRYNGDKVGYESTKS